MGGSSGEIGGDGARTFWGDSSFWLVLSPAASGAQLLMWCCMVLLFMRCMAVLRRQQVESAEYPGSVPKALPPERDRRGRRPREALAEPLRQRATWIQRAMWKRDGFGDDGH